MCDIVEDGEQAYKACLKKVYDIVFMDCQMPVMDGYEAARKIRGEESEGKHIKIVAMTANAMDGDKEKCLKAGMDEYLSKPIDFKLMFKIIEETTHYSAVKEKRFEFLEKSMNQFKDGLGIKMDEVRDIFNDYISYLPQILIDIEKALQDKDFDSLRGLAHKLKGSSGNLRVNEIFELAQKLEESAEEKDKKLKA